MSTTWSEGHTETYSPSQNTYTDVLVEGIYKIEMYGGQGEGTRSGYGGHSIGVLQVSESTTVYINSALSGTSSYSSPEYANYGGGKSRQGSMFQDGYAGGGSSDVRLRTDSPLNRVIVAGGGGGSGGYFNYDGQTYDYPCYGGNGGGSAGTNGYITDFTPPYQNGGTQSAAGNSYESARKGDVYALGYGGDGVNGTMNCGSGGGGWHGGGAGYMFAKDILESTTACPCGGGGGSGFIYTQLTPQSSLPSGFALTSDDQLLLSYEYQGQTITTITEAQTQVQHTGDGIVYITCLVLGGGGNLPLWVKKDNAWVEAQKLYVKKDNAWAEAQSISAKHDGAWS